LSDNKYTLGCFRGILWYRVILPTFVQYKTFVMKFGGFMLMLYNLVCWKFCQKY